MDPMRNKMERLSPPEQLRLWRMRRGLTQAELGDQLEVTLTTVLRLERGYAAPGAELGLRIQKLTGVSYGEPRGRANKGGT
jgi:transcriptional regulator with XRE-family HTH domain